MKNLTQRAITGTLFVVVMLAGIVFSYYSLFILFSLIAILATVEYSNLINKSGEASLPTLLLAVLTMLSCVLVFFAVHYSRPFWLLSFFPIVLLVPLVELYRKTSSAIKNVVYGAWSQLYVTVAFMAWVVFSCFDGSVISTQYFNEKYLLGFILLVWTNDTFAYVFGMALGKHKLFERHSPKKTWEGFIGGALTSVVLAYFFAELIPVLGAAQWISIAVIVAVTGTLGDLVESMFKRSLNSKDSGSLLPGHGGLLDRFDAFLIATPFVLFFILITNG